MTQMLPRNPAIPAGTGACCGEPVHYNYKLARWYHDTPAASLNCSAAEIKPLLCGHCNDTHDVHQRRRGPLCDGCFSVAPVIAEYGTGLVAEAQADGEHVKLKVDAFNPFGSSAYLTADDTRALIELLETQLGVMGCLEALQPAGELEANSTYNLDNALYE